MLTELRNILLPGHTIIYTLVTEAKDLITSLGGKWESFGENCRVPISGHRVGRANVTFIGAFVSFSFCIFSGLLLCACITIVIRAKPLLK